MRKIVPTVFIAFGTSALLAMALTPGYRSAPAWFFAIPTLPIAFALLFLKADDPEPDEVLDGGDCLLIRKGRVSVRVPLAGILEIERRGKGTRYRAIHLRLAQDGPLGNEIDFFERGGPAGIDVVADLKRRIDRARRASGGQPGIMR